MNFIHNEVTPASNKSAISLKGAKVPEQAVFTRPQLRRLFSKPEKESPKLRNWVITEGKARVLCNTRRRIQIYSSYTMIFPGCGTQEKSPTLATNHELKRSTVSAWKKSARRVSSVVCAFPFTSNLHQPDPWMSRAYERFLRSWDRKIFGNGWIRKKSCDARAACSFVASVDFFLSFKIDELWKNSGGPLGKTANISLFFRV